MNTIKATYNITTKEWDIDTTTDPIAKTFYELEFAFCSSEEVTVFSDLKFGYEVHRTDKELPGEAWVASDHFPKNSAMLQQVTSTVPIQTSTIACLPGIEHTVKVWANNAGENTEAIYTFTSSIPKQPFASWTWNGVEWAAPTARPTGIPAFWNEVTQAWVEVVNPIDIDDDSRDDESRANMVS